ncbi:MAG: cardiolipin synthase [Myxococcota bacterium]|nr:cardiolipin synthase [Myxococcota bacterium]
MTAWFEVWWPYLATATLALVELVAASHAVLNKREVRAATAWVGMILLVPGIGVLLYLLLGINRIDRLARRTRGDMRRYEHATQPAVGADQLESRLVPADAHLAEIARTIDRTSRWPLLPGNRIAMLRDGDETYPEMLRCIAAAERSIALVSYIFDNDAAGRRFVDALAAARERGVEVRVLIDDAGARYSWPAIDRMLRQRGVSVARFLRVLAPWSAAFANLRNHRKILVVDGTIGFTGGMNIRHECVLSETPRHPTRDLHFRVEGPVVTQLMDVFAEDWTFATREVLAGERWFPALPPIGDAFARAISDGPDRDLDCMRWALHGAIASARRSVRVVTPYFLPDEPLITALNVAALRGVDVDLLLPHRGNLRIVNWAMRGELWKVLHHGCRVWLTPPPFDHSKIMVVDGAWTLLGSANWDPRSLRLNFELGVECYDRDLAAKIDGFVDERIATAARLDAALLASVRWPTRLRDSTARLFSPYL